MNCRVWQLVSAACVILTGTVCAETETIDLRALAKKARPAVMLLVVSNAAGKEIATGTGFLVSSDGKLITNHHVIENAASAVAKAENGGLFPVDGVLADDPKNDLVLLKLKGKDLPFLPLGNSDKIEVGTRIAVIGSPLGLEGTLSEGIVSGVRDLTGDVKVLQVTAAISPGSSGSPVMNAKGDVIGIASALLHGGQALNFAVPIEQGNRLLTKIKQFTIAQPLGEFVPVGSDRIFADPNWRAFHAARLARDWGGMLKPAQNLIDRFPDNHFAYNALSTAYVALHFYDDALAAARQSIKLKPEDAVNWFGLGFIYSELGKCDAAIAPLQQAIKLDAKLASAWTYLGIAHTKCGHDDEAIVAFREALKLEPENASAWAFLGLACRKAGKMDDARKALEQAEKLDPNLSAELSK